jgi:hypothetical protein
VTRGTRPKKPSSSRGFARKARGARGVQGVWGLKTENRNLKIEKNFSLSKPATTTKFFIFYFLSRPRGRARVHADAPERPDSNFPPKSSFMTSLAETQ